MAAKAKIYTEKDYPADAVLISQLREAVERLAEESKASRPIYRHKTISGYGIDKAQRGIAADSVISIAKAIKSQGGW